MLEAVDPAQTESTDGAALRVALVSIGNCPSLALRNIKSYCLADPAVAKDVVFDVYDYDIRDFRDSRAQSSQQWSFVTKFDEAVRDLVATEPQFLAFSCYLWNTELSVHLAQLVKLVLPNVVVVLGGPDAGPRASELLASSPAVDLVVEGDGEIPFLELLRVRLDEGEDRLSSVPGLRFRGPDGFVANPPPASEPDLSVLRDVWDDPPDQPELSAWAWPHLLVETLRGCPYSCSFCMYGKTKMNAKSAEAAVEELAVLLEKGLLVEIVDPTFTTYQKRAKEILRALAERSYSGQLTIEAYPDSLDEEMADLIVAARVCCIGLGFQTASAEGLKAVRRPRNFEKFERAVGYLQDRNLHFYVDIIYGLPGTSIEDFFATVDYLNSLGITKLMIYRLLGLPGSPMMADVEEHGLVFSKSPPYELLKSHTYSHEDIMFCEAFREAYDRFPGEFTRDRFEQLAANAGGVSTLLREHLGGSSADDLLERWGSQPGASRRMAGGAT